MNIPLNGEGREYYFPHGEDCPCEQCLERQDELRAVTLDFRSFLDYWQFVDQDTGVVRTLGKVLWPAQEEYVRVAEMHNWVYYLKARQLGESTLECAYDGWAARFREGGVNARIHLFSKREKDAQELHGRVRFGLEHLPTRMQLPVGKSNQSEYELIAGPEDTRVIVAYPADNDTARGQTCNHAHVDEWAFMGSPGRVWQAIEPSAAGTVHILTTGQGPQNWTATFWKKCLVGDVKDRKGAPIYPCFIGALNRPDRTKAWLRAKRKGMDEQTFLQEYPMRWEDALSGGGPLIFRSRDLDAAGVDFRPLGPAQPGRKYVIGIDIGRHQDAAVIVTLDVTEDVFDVVDYRRLREYPYPLIQREIKVVAEAYPGPVSIEDNAAGEAVRENLDLPEWRLHGFTTSKPSKMRILQQLNLALQNQTLKWDALACEQLDSEMRGYQMPDDDVVQDSVMALAIALEHADHAYRPGRVLAVTQV